MRNYKIFILLIVILLLHFCNKGNDRLNVENIDYNSISITERSTKDFMALGTIKKVVQPELKDNSIIGSVDSVIVDENGDFYVGDYDSSKKVFRFNGNGKFITTYGRIGQGPGEYTHIIRFELSPDNKLILMALNKLIKFTKKGKFIKEVRLKYNGIDIKAIDDLIYIAVSGYRYNTIEKTQIVILDSDFKTIGGISTYDTRLDKYKFLPLNLLAKNNSNLFFIDIYDFRIQIFNKKENKIIQLNIPNENDYLNDIWRKSNFTEKDRTVIKKKLHRFNSIFALKDRLFLTESCRYKKIFNYWILNYEKKKALFLKYPDLEFFENNLFFNRIVGSFDKGIIGVFNDVDKFNKYKKDFPVLNDIEFDYEDNPILVLFEINKT